jgi:hypothetical protein
MKKFLKFLILRIKESSLLLYVRIYCVVLVFSIIIIVFFWYGAKILKLEFYTNLLNNLALIYLELLDVLLKWLESRNKKNVEEE